MKATPTREDDPCFQAWLELGVDFRTRSSGPVDQSITAMHKTLGSFRVEYIDNMQEASGVVESTGEHKVVSVVNLTPGAA